MKQLLQNQKVKKRKYKPAVHHKHVAEYVSVFFKNVTGAATRRPHVFAGSIAFTLIIVMYLVMFGSQLGGSPLGLYTGPAPSLLATLEPGDVREKPAEEEESVPASGSGTLQINREEDYDHRVVKGETLSEIAYIYKISTQKLAYYNKIENVHSIRAGDVVRIPSKAKEKQLAQQQNIEEVRLATSSIKATTTQSALPKLKIAAREQYDGRGVTAHFYITEPSTSQLTAYEWDLGDGRKSFRSTTFWTYDRPGTYRISLDAKLRDGRYVESNEIYIDVPHPATYRTEYQSFITLRSMDEHFALSGTLKSILNYSSIDDAPIESVSSNFDSTIYRFTEPGYYNLTLEEDGIRSNVYVFVSPVDSVHVERTDLNWYRTQFNTGSQSNCGPSTVSMAVAWAKGEYVPVSTVRQQVGWHSQRLGATTLEELYRSLRKNGVQVGFKRLNSKENLFQAIDNGNIAIVLFSTGDIPAVNGTPDDDLFGRYYTYTQGHYVVIKGYTKDKNHFIVYDPIPSDWGSNSLRHEDGISMIGRNRYYPADDLYRSIRSKRIEYLEIVPQ